MKKYANRSMPIVTRTQPAVSVQSDDISSEFLSELQKMSVQPKAQVHSLYDQMSSIMNGAKPKYPSVEAAVKDMLDRTGISGYKQQLQAQQETKQIIAYTKKAEIQVELFKQIPQIKQTIDNYIQSTRGNLLVPEILDHIRSIHKNDVLDPSFWSSPSLLMYINEKNTAEKQTNPDVNNEQHLGKVDYSDTEVDPSNMDALHMLTPATVGK